MFGGHDMRQLGKAAGLELCEAQTTSLYRESLTPRSVDPMLEEAGWGAGALPSIRSQRSVEPTAIVLGRGMPSYFPIVAFPSSLRDQPAPDLRCLLLQRVPPPVPGTPRTSVGEQKQDDGASTSTQEQKVGVVGDQHSEVRAGAVHFATPQACGPNPAALWAAFEKGCEQFEQLAQRCEDQVIVDTAEGVMVDKQVTSPGHLGPEMSGLRKSPLIDLNVGFHDLEAEAELTRPMAARPALVPAEIRLNRGTGDQTAQKSGGKGIIRLVVPLKKSLLCPLATNPRPIRGRRSLK